MTGSNANTAEHSEGTLPPIFETIADFVARFRTPLFIVIVLAQLFVLVMMIVERERILAEGRTIVLATAPIDPRSLLSGDYVTLRYEISFFSYEQIQSMQYDYIDAVASGDPVYVAFEEIENEGDAEAQPGAPTHRAVALGLDRDYLKANWEIVVRAEAENSYDAYADNPRGLNLRYGLESFFVPEFEGLAIERELRDATVEVAVDEETGKAGIKRLFIGGKEVTFGKEDEAAKK